MAVEMMTMGDLDKQFLDNNLLTDEDLQFAHPVPLSFTDDTGILEEALEHNGILSYLNDEMEISRNMGIDSGSENNYMDIIDESIIDFLNETHNPVEIKMEPLSPYSCRGSPLSPEVILSSDSDIPVLSIPEPCDYSDGLIVPDTPPHTPPNFTDQNGVVNSSSNSILMTVTPCSVATPAVMSTSPSIIQGKLQNGTCVSIGKTAPSADVKIKPKPLLNGCSVNGTANCKPLVLTPQQFAMLTNGKLKVKSVCEVSSAGGGNPSSLQTKNSSVVSSKHLPILNKKNILRTDVLRPIVDLTAIKRQQRMIKNRESACLSRKKKKEYMQKLETEIKEISSENNKLQYENVQLKQHVSHLEKENAGLKVLNIELKNRLSPTALKKTTGLMVVLFMVSLNLSPISSIFDKPIANEVQKIPPHRIGRTLLWENNAKSGDIANSSSRFRKMRSFKNGNFSLHFTDNMYSTFNATMCPMYINRTESERLDNDLRGWVQRVEKKQKLKESYGLNSRKGLPPIPKLQSWIRRKNDHAWNRQHGKNEILVYHTPRNSYEEFFDAIHRRDDTFYFVSFSGDHLLLPATAHNQTLRPRMSLVMPAMTFNDSMGHLDDHVCMMQIDCEVMNTKLVYVKQSAIPEHLRQKSNTTKTPLHKKPIRIPVNSKTNSLQKHRIDTVSYE